MHFCVEFLKEAPTARDSIAQNNALGLGFGQFSAGLLVGNTNGVLQSSPGLPSEATLGKRAEPPTPTRVVARTGGRCCQSVLYAQCASLAPRNECTTRQRSLSRRGAPTAWRREPQPPASERNWEGMHRAVALLESSWSANCMEAGASTSTSQAGVPAGWPRFRQRRRFSKLK